jgi:hypothetical protein
MVPLEPATSGHVEDEALPTLHVVPPVGVTVGVGVGVVVAVGVGVGVLVGVGVGVLVGVGVGVAVVTVKL